VFCKSIVTSLSYKKRNEQHDVKGMFQARLGVSVINNCKGLLL
jgi:hypothetical protein